MIDLLPYTIYVKLKQSFYQKCLPLPTKCPFGSMVDLGQNRKV